MRDGIYSRNSTLSAQAAEFAHRGSRFYGRTKLGNVELVSRSNALTLCIALVWIAPRGSSRTRVAVVTSRDVRPRCPTRPATGLPPVPGFSGQIRFGRDFPIRAGKSTRFGERSSATGQRAGLAPATRRRAKTATTPPIREHGIDAAAHAWYPAMPTQHERQEA